MSATPPRRETATFSVPEVAGLLGVGTGTVYQMLRAGELPARKAGDRWIISKRRLITWLDGDDQNHESALVGAGRPTGAGAR